MLAPDTLQASDQNAWTQMTDTMNSQWLNPPPDGRRFALALGAGLLLELAGLFIMLPAMSHHESPADTPSVVKLSIVAPAPKPPAPPKPTPVPPKPVTPPPPLPVAPPIPMPPPPPLARLAQHVVRHYVKPRVQPPPATPPVAQTPPAPPPPPAPAAPTGGQVDAFSAAIKRALQAHANDVYPQAAQMAHETGSPQLTFTYLNGAVTGIAITQSSGFPLLDAAALQDARMAQYPAPPPGFAGRVYHITVSVDFVLSAASVDGD
jgi:protein TonB